MSKPNTENQEPSSAEVKNHIVKGKEKDSYKENESLDDSDNSTEQESLTETDSDEDLDLEVEKKFRKVDNKLKTVRNEDLGCKNLRGDDEFTKIWKINGKELHDVQLPAEEEADGYQTEEDTGLEELQDYLEDITDANTSSSETEDENPDDKVKAMNEILDACRRTKITENEQ